ncbi:MAG: C10 family peptidase [Rikenellaceae bacterium]
MIEEIKEYRPLYMRGSSKRYSNEFLGINFGYTYEGGHAWVVDGMLELKRSIIRCDANTGEIMAFYEQNNKYLHYNIGWGGSFNAYYLLGSFDIDDAEDYPGTVQLGNIVLTDESMEGEDGNFQYMVKTIFEIY